MQIIFGDPPEELVEKYVVLELDTIKYSEDADPITAYCVVGGEHVTLEEMSEIKQNCDTHRALIMNYYKKNWEFCIQSIEALRGKFRGELDSFYDVLESRIRDYKNGKIESEWDGILRKF